MTSGRKLAPVRLGAYFNRLPSKQIGIGHYEQVIDPPQVRGVGADTAPQEFLPQVVKAPEGDASASEVARRNGAKAALYTVGVFGLFVAACYGGFRVTRSMQGAS